ncbi:aminopeptidase PepB [Rheinheimera baltica]|uniref:aminopeptidase PepB n=1 Tax=Rheinheimera baltica TaxID=67576 RepID=UPI0003FD6930|nr:aminopeptidase PepB [Rheinheimera baltica]
MTDVVQITLQQHSADTKWGKALFSPIADGFQLHFNIHDATRSVQKAARSLESLGLLQVQLAGDGWTIALQWAFYQGFCTAKKHNGVLFCGDADTQRQLQHMVQCFSWAKQLTNQTPDELYPEQLAILAARFIEQVAAKGTVQSQILLDEQLLAAGWHGLHAVGRGSARKPAMLILDYNPTANADTPVSAALVGKGITFDSGGYSIKATESMLTMKCDMGGAATVTAALALAILQGLNKRVQLILCCAENLISSTAYKLGDIITYKNGTTVEVVNTDAEGRLVLADGLMCAAESGANLIIDAATLTGAAVTAVGAEFNALFALDKQLALKALAYAEQSDEPTWQLPLEHWHKQQCPSAYADTANSRPVKGGGAGGASNAAGFLSRFVPHDGKGWLHFDLAAAFNNSNNGYWAAGATGQGIRTISTTLLAEV